MSSRILCAGLFAGLLIIAGCGASNDNGSDNQVGQDVQVREDLLGDVGAGQDTAVRPDTEQTDDTLPPVDQGGVDTAGGTDTAVGQDSAVGEDTTAPVDTVGPSDNGTGDPDVVVEPIPFTCSSGKAVVSGWNKGWTVAGNSRDFYVVMPSDTQTKPVGVIFVFHGFGDSVDNFKSFFNPNPDADADFPYVLVYPKSMGLQPYGGKGIEWSIFTSSPGDSNPDALLFEEILGCLADTVNVDSGSVFSFGFSAGAIFTNLLHSRYPDVLHAVLSMSGAWFNDSDTVDGVNTMGMATLNWADLIDQSGTVFMTHGGETDTYGGMGVTIIDFEQSAQYAKPFLTGHGRTVIDCPHTSGHTNHPQLSISAMIRYFKDHRGGVPSPYVADGLPAVFPAGCTVLPPE